MENNEQKDKTIKNVAGFIIIIMGLLVVAIGTGGYFLYKNLCTNKKTVIEEKEKPFDISKYDNTRLLTEYTGMNYEK